MKKEGLLLVKGGVFLVLGGWVSITDAKKKVLPPHAPYPIGSKKIKKDETTKEEKINNNEAKENSAEKVENNKDEKSKNDINKGRSRWQVRQKLKLLI